MLDRLIAGADRYHAAYAGGLCNHLPMALIALDRMGRDRKDSVNLPAITPCGSSR
jgi:hypothetical protein